MYLHGKLPLTGREKISPRVRWHFRFIPSSTASYEAESRRWLEQQPKGVTAWKPALYAIKVQRIIATESACQARNLLELVAEAETLVFLATYAGKG
jgi:hypothetical protein